MAKGSVKDPFKKTSPMKQGAGASIGRAAGSALGTLIPIPGVGNVIGGAVGGMIGGLFDKKPKEKGLSEAEIAMEKRLKQYEQSEFVGQNPYEDMTVNLQAADFQRQQQAQETADLLASLRGGSGGAGAAALATSLARSSAAKQQQIAGQIGQQEQAIGMAKAQADLSLQQQQRKFEQEKLATLLGIDMSKVTAEEQARLSAEQGKMDRRSQLLGTGLSALGNVASSAVEGGLTFNFGNEQSDGVDYQAEDNPIMVGVQPE